jgi:hypothetical protein
MVESYIILFILMAFLAGFYFYVKRQTGTEDDDTFEGFASAQTNCPNMLVQTGSKFKLFNSNNPKVKPIEFDNLEDYTTFLEWQHKNGVTCPVLYLQQTSDVQGDDVFKVRPSVTEPQGGLLSHPVPAGQKYVSELLDTPNNTKLVDASHDDPPYNRHGYPAFDQSSYYVGSTTPDMAINNTPVGSNKSGSAMETNWDSPAFTQKMIDQGAYKGSEVSIRVA